MKVLLHFISVCISVVLLVSFRAIAAPGLEIWILTCSTWKLEYFLSLQVGKRFENPQQWQMVKTRCRNGTKAHQ